MNWRFMFGYTIRRGEIRINEGEAKIVREIFIRVLEGESFGSICRDLNKRGIPRTLGGTWSPAHMRELLRNEKYAGNALLQKRYVNNHLEKKLVRNNGELPQYFVEESHPAIVSKETFDAVQKRLQQINIALSGRKKPQRSELSGKIRCPRCGKPYRRVTSNGSVGWNCSTFVSEGKKGCWGKKIPDDALKAAIAKALALAEYDASSCEERVNCIVPREGNTLEVVLNDGRTGTVTWEERSRAESWTPEMKERARHAAQRKRTCVK